MSRRRGDPSRRSEGTADRSHRRPDPRHRRTARPLALELAHRVLLRLRPEGRHLPHCGRRQPELLEIQLSSAAGGEETENLHHRLKRQGEIGRDPEALLAQLLSDLVFVETRSLEFSQDHRHVLLRQVLRAMPWEGDLDALAQVVPMARGLARLQNESVGQEPALEGAAIDLVAHKRPTSSLCRASLDGSTNTGSTMISTPGRPSAAKRLRAMTSTI